MLDGKPRSATDANEDTYDSTKTHEVVNLMKIDSTVQIEPDFLTKLHKINDIFVFNQCVIQNPATDRSNLR